ncbi:hypothetical protein V2J09_015107 [Rumex salicifolius]
MEMIALVSRTGRQFQRYQNGRRLVVGSIPYRYKKNGSVEVLVISSQKGQGMLFPKGGWEEDESVEEAACRETLEEAGVLGIVQGSLGSWNYKSKRQNAFHQGRMFPLLVTKQLDLWPEKDARQRRWVDLEDARDLCRDCWMKEALERLMDRLSAAHTTSPCSLKTDCFQLESDCISLFT